MVDIRDLLGNQEAKLRQQRTQFWKDALAKQDNEFVDKVVKANRDLIWNHVALLHEIKCEIAAQLGEDTAAELVPEDCTAGIAEISRSSPSLLGSRFSPDIQSKSSANSKRSRTTSSRAGGIGASRPVGFEVSPPPCS